MARIARTATRWPGRPSEPQPVVWSKSYTQQVVVVPVGFAKASATSGFPRARRCGAPPCRLARNLLDARGGRASEGLRLGKLA